MTPNAYDRLSKPGWSPSATRISQVWTYLYPLIIASFGYTLFRTLDGWYPASFRVPLILNFILLVIFTRMLPQQRHPRRVLVAMLAVDITLIIAIIMIIPDSPAITVAQIPYLIWIGLLTATQIAIVRRNGNTPAAVSAPTSPPTVPSDSPQASSAPVSRRRPPINKPDGPKQPPRRML